MLLYKIRENVGSPIYYILKGIAEIPLILPINLREEKTAP